jgi:hypothetical protein
MQIQYKVITNETDTSTLQFMDLFTINIWSLSKNFDSSSSILTI